MSHPFPTSLPEPVPVIPAESGAVAPESMSIPRLLEALTEGRADPSVIGPERRAACVDHLTGEGWGIDEIAELLGVSPRTVDRDRQALRRERALTPRLTLGDELLGEYERHTQASLGRLTRLARDAGTPPSVRLWAEESASRIYHRFIDTARKLEYVEDGKQRLKFARETGPEYERRELARQVSAYRRNGNAPPEQLLKALNALGGPEGAKAQGCG